jgi:hypothetical protein
VDLSREEIYHALLNIGLTSEQIEREIQKKIQDFNGYLSHEGSVFLVAKDHHLVVEQEFYQELQNKIDYNEFVITISEVHENMMNIVVLGKISRVYGIKEFVHKDGTQGRVGTFVLSDGTGEIKVVAWGNHTKFLESDYFQVNALIRILNGYCKKNDKGSLEIHIGKKGKIILAPDDVNLTKFPLLEHLQIVQNEQSNPLKIKDLHHKEGFIPSIEGKILRMEEFAEKKVGDQDITFLLKFILQDETGQIPVVLWGMQAVNGMKVMDEKRSLRLKKIVVKINPFNKTYEIHFNNKSEIEII